MTYEEWFQKKVNADHVISNLTFKDFGAIVARCTLRGDITGHIVEGDIHPIPDENGEKQEFCTCKMGEGKMGLKPGVCGNKCIKCGLPIK